MTLAIKRLASVEPTVLLDKLGERCAFERRCTRLYQAVLRRFEAFGEIPGGPTVDELKQLLADEARHFDLVAEAIRELGGDPTCETTYAEVSGVASSRVLQVVTDPRTSPAQCFHALLTVELADRDGWERLIRFAAAVGYEELATRFSQALLDEEHHLVSVRQWLSELAFFEADVEAEETAAGILEQLTARRAALR